MDWLELLLLLLFIVGPTLWGVLRGEGKPDNSGRPLPATADSEVYVLKPEGKDILYQALAEFLDPRGVDGLLGRYLRLGATVNSQEFRYIQGLVARRLGAERAEAVMNAAFTRVGADAQPVGRVSPVSIPPAPPRPRPGAAVLGAYVLAPRGRETLTQTLEPFLGRDATTTVLSKNITAGGAIDVEGFQRLEALLVFHLGREEAAAILRSALAPAAPFPQPPAIYQPPLASQTPPLARPLPARNPELSAMASLRASVAPVSSSLTQVQTSTTSRPNPVAPTQIQSQPLLDLTSPHAVLNGVIWHEILGEPRARQIHALRRTPRKRV